jgi:Tfp pilus assembly protein PilN
MWLERWRRTRRLSHRLVAGAAALLLLSAGFELWGAHRELAALHGQRETIRGTVVKAMELREAVAEVDDRLRGLAAAETAASRWSGVIADVAEHLPADAHLISLRGAGDSLVLEGVAARAAGVFESLQQAPGVAGVRAEAPIRQEARDSAPPVERFSLGARLAASPHAAAERQ